MINSILLKLSALTTQRLLILGLFLGGVYFFTLYDDGAAIKLQIAAIDTQLQSQLQKEKETDKALQEVEKIRATVGELSNQFRIVSQALPSEIQMSDIIREVDRVAQISGVVIKSKEPRTNLNHGYYEEIPLHIVMHGSFSEIGLFLYNIASVERMMKAKDFTMTRMNGEKMLSGKLLFEGQVVSYRFVGEKAKEGGKL